MLKTLIIALFALNFSFAYAEENEVPTNELKTEISEEATPSYKSANIVLEYTAGFGQLGIDAAMTEKLAFVARYGVNDLLSNKKLDWKGSTPTLAELKAYSLGLDYFATANTFSDSLIVGLRAYQVRALLSPGYRIKYGNKILADNDTLTSAQALLSYKWFSDRAHINGGPGLAYDLAQKSGSIHFSFGVTF